MGTAVFLNIFTSNKVMSVHGNIDGDFVFEVMELQGLICCISFNIARLRKTRISCTTHIKTLISMLPGAQNHSDD